MKAWLRQRWKLLVIVLAALTTPLWLHLGITWISDLDPPKVVPPAGQVAHQNGDVRLFGPAFVRRRGSIFEVHLQGHPAEIGYRHVRLLYDEMVENEGIVLSSLDEHVPNPLLRWLLLDLARLKFRNLDAGMSSDRLHEIAGGALAFQPDPYDHLFETYQRFVYLNALYDMSLSFEESPLIGCTTFTLSADAVTAGDGLLARAFDFEVFDIFDRKKAVFFVRETGKIPFASVAWPGLVGVVSGMNAEGVAVVVHGGRAGETSATGEPVVHALRRVLAEARTTEQAVDVLKAREPMVSHIVVVSDASGKSASIERVPGRATYLQWLQKKAVVTNHFQGGAADDPKNIRVRNQTSTVARYRRGEQLLTKLKRPASVKDAVAMLRDRQGLNDAPLKLGNRSAIDALIATHGVVMDTTARVLWVSEGPHLLGRFLAFDLKKLLAENVAPEAVEPRNYIEADPLLNSPQYERYRKQLE